MMDQKQREKCLKEVGLLKELNHPHIIRFLDSFLSEKDMHIILEWASRGDLKRVLRRAVQSELSLPEGQIWEYMRQLSSALSYMQTKRIMHRDIKPANIFLAEDGTLKLGDLGLGRFFSSQTMEAFSKVGTPLYMSPELLKGDGYDMKSDVWSLGCVFYELCVRRSPFKHPDKNMSLYDLFLAISKGTYDPLPEGFSSDLRETVDGMLTLEVGKRLSMEEVDKKCTQMTKQESAGDPARPLRPSPFLVMDDIVEKLKILNAEELFLKPRNLPAIHRCYFAMALELPPPLTQFGVMVELMHWLADFAQASAECADVSAGPAPPRGSAGSISSFTGGGVTGGDAAAGGGTDSGKVRWQAFDPHAAVDSVVSKLAAVLDARGLPLSSETTLGQLRQGHGEGVCLLVNELINQELVRRNFHFEAPDWAAAFEEENNQALSAEEDVDPPYTVAEILEEISGEEEAEVGWASDHLISPARPGAPLYLPIHNMTVDTQAWESEVKRFTELRALIRLADSPYPAIDRFRRATTRVAQLASAAPELKVLAGGLREDLDGIRRGEQGLRKPGGERWRDQQQELAEVTARLNALRERAAESEAHLAGLAAEEEHARSELRDRSDRLQDNAPLLKMRESVLRLERENAVLKLRVGAARQMLGMRAKVQHQEDLPAFH